MGSRGLICNFDVPRCLAHQVRRLIGDFGVPIAIFIMIAIDISIEDAYTQVGIAWEGVTSSQKKNNNQHAIFLREKSVYLILACPSLETGCPKRSSGVQPQRQRLDHKPWGNREDIPTLDDGGLLCSSNARLHPHLPGVPDHYVSGAVRTIIAV